MMSIHLGRRLLRLNKKHLYYLGLGLLLICLPVVLVILVSPYLFPGSFVSDAVNFIPSTEDVNLTKLDSTPKAIKVSKGASFAQLKSDIALDPAADENFLVSFLVKFQEFPGSNIRQNILTKYAAETKPYPGWAIAICNLSTSLRLQVYWQGLEGRGGWHSYDDVSLDTDKWYGLTLILKKDKSLLLLVEDISKNEVTFAGGMPIGKIVLPSSESDIVLGSNRFGPQAFKGEVAQILFAYPEKVADERAGLISLVKGGPPSIVSKLSRDEINLWISESGKDKSRFQREVTLVGNAQWLPTVQSAK